MIITIIIIIIIIIIYCSYSAIYIYRSEALY